MDEHDQAAQWAQANPQDPRAQDIMAKAWASKNPDDPRATQILGKVGAPAKSGQQTFAAKHPYISGAVTALNPALTVKGYADDLKNSPNSGLSNVGGLVRTQAEHAANTLGLGYLPQVEGGIRSLISGKPYVDSRDQVIQRMQQDAQDYPSAASMGKFAGAGAGMAMAPAFKGATGIGKLLAGGATGAAYGAASNPGDTKGVVDPIQAGDRAGDAVVGGLMGTGAAALPMAANAARGAANSMMKRAVGLTGASSKSFPNDIGNRIADEGIWGTKQGMSDQVAEKYAASEARVQDLAKQAQGTYPSADLADAVAQGGNQYVDKATGLPIPGGEAGYKAYNRAAGRLRSSGAGFAPGSPEQVSTRSMLDSTGDPVELSRNVTPATPSSPGGYNGESLLQLKRTNDAEAFNQSGMQGNTYKADAARSTADAARTGLSNLTGGEMPDALRQEQTLLAAHKGLNKPDMTYRNPVTLTDIGAAMNTAGLPGKAGSVLAAKGWVSPLAQSMAAQGAQQVVAPALSTAGAAGQQMNPYLYQILYGDKNVSN